ncbi:MAG: protein-export chaperone SecB [Raoultibacter sp.]
MALSDFQFTSPVLLGIQMNVNKDYTPDKEKKVPIHAEVNVNVLKVKALNEAQVTLYLSVNKDMSDSAPYVIEAEITSLFTWDKEAYTDEMLNGLLKQNAPALLISYIRPLIAMITNASPYETCTIPFMDFTKE